MHELLLETGASRSLVRRAVGVCIVIESIKHIRSVGRFKEDAPSALSFANLTLIYAENAKGKSTLAAVFRSLAASDPEPIIERTRLGAVKEPHVVIDCCNIAVFQAGAWNRQESGIVVYDDQFVDDNVHSGLEVESEHRKNLHTWIIGSKAVALDRQVRKLASVVEEHNRTLKQIESRIDSGVLRGMNIQMFCDIPVDPEIDAKIDAARGRLQAADQAEAIAKAPLLETLHIEPISLDPLNIILGQSLPKIEEAALNKVREHFRSLGAGGERWVAERAAPPGSAEASEQAICPYCGRSLAGVELIEHYQAYFSEAYRSLVASIDESLRGHTERNRSLVVTAFGDADRVAQQRRTFWARFDPSLPLIDFDPTTIARCWARLDEAIVRQLQEKQRRPLDHIALSEDVERESAELAAHVSSLKAVNRQIAEINKKVQELKDVARDQDRQSLADELISLERTKSRHSAEIGQHCSDYIAELAKKGATENDRIEARAELEEERERAFEEFPIQLNSYLDEFNADFRIDQLRPTNTRSGTSSDFSLVIEEIAVPLQTNNRRVHEEAPQQFRNTLSAGDRRTLASAIYFAGVDRAAKAEGVVAVIDDPASSLDENRTKATAQAIGSLAKRIDQVIVLSHSKQFLDKIAGFTHGVATSYLQIADRAGVSHNAGWDIEADLQDDHLKRHNRLVAFIDGADDNPSDVVREIRPHLEHFLRITLPAEFVETQMLGQFIGSCRKSAAEGIEVMSSERLEELEKLNDFATTFHHNGSLESRTELVGFAKRALRFAKPEFNRS